MKTTRQPQTVPGHGTDQHSAQERAAALSFELHTSARLLRRHFDRQAVAHGLSRARWQVLWILARGEGLKQAELADRLDIAPISLTRQLDQLQREGLIERRSDPEDRRCYRVYLAAAARPALALLETLALSTRKRAFAGLSSADMQQLQALLSRIRENLGDD
jgi:DNA-binding MarR family transcriptional regulator